jgi:hypothetical protein
MRGNELDVTCSEISPLLGQGLPVSEVSGLGHESELANLTSILS